MFGKPSWFRENSRLAIPLPVVRAGWRYYGGWLAAILVPTLMLVWRGQVFPEAMIWIGVSAGAFLLEIRRLQNELRQRSALARMHHIDDAAGPVETESWLLEIKQ